MRQRATEACAHATLPHPPHTRSFTAAVAAAPHPAHARVAVAAATAAAAAAACGPSCSARSIAWRAAASGAAGGGGSEATWGSSPRSESSARAASAVSGSSLAWRRTAPRAASTAPARMCRGSGSGFKAPARMCRVSRSGFKADDSVWVSREVPVRLRPCKWRKARNPKRAGEEIKRLFSAIHAESVTPGGPLTASAALGCAGVVAGLQLGEHH